MNHLGSLPIATPRLLLRPFTREDAPAMYHNWAADEETVRYLSWHPHLSEETSRNILTAQAGRYENTSYYSWAIVLKEIGQPIGCIGINSLSNDARSCNVGYYIGRAYWGKGIMTEALKAVIDFLFFKIGLHRVEAGHFPQNPASGRVMEKAGMRYEGLSRKAICCKGIFYDCHLYAILKEDLFEASGLKLEPPREEHGEAFEEMSAEWGEEPIVPYSARLLGRSYDAWLRDTRAAVLQPPEGFVPADTLLLTRGAGVLGAVNIRHELNDALLRTGGHIGYGIRPGERGKGQARLMLALALEKCRELGLNRVLITCDKTNAASAGTIRSNGGVPENEVIDADGRTICRFWITL